MCLTQLAAVDSTESNKRKKKKSFNNSETQSLAGDLYLYFFKFEITKIKIDFGLLLLKRFGHLTQNFE